MEPNEKKGNTMNTNKFSGGIMDEYYRLFPIYKNKPIKLLEIGTFNNGFLDWASDYFKNVTLFGIDNVCRDQSENCILIKANQNDTDRLKEICDKYGKFDIIIDDASHFTKETKNTFDIFWRHLSENGVYVIEDWAVGYWDNKGEHTRRNGMEKLVADLIVNKNKLGIKNLEIILKEPSCSLACFYK